MGNIFTVINSDSAQSKSEELFKGGLRLARAIKSQTPKNRIDLAYAKAATFARNNGSGGEMVVDDSTGCWLMAAGSWFHTNGYGAGSEQRLLHRMIKKSVARVAPSLEGFFVLIFCDARSREIYVVTDLTGGRHCFIRVFSDCLALSTSSLLLASLGDSTPDALATDEFLRTGTIYEDRTLFCEVKKLEPATIYRFSGGVMASAVRYWRMSDLDPEAFDGEDAAQSFSERLVAVTERIASTYRRPVCDLTGGYNSRLVVAAFLNAGVGFETTVIGRETDPDALISRNLSELIGATNSRFKPDEAIPFRRLEEALRITDGECDLLNFAEDHAPRNSLSGRFDVSVNGACGEIARGYEWSALFPKVGRRERVDCRELAAKCYTADPCSPELFPPGASFDIVEHIATMIGQLNKPLDGWPNTSQMDHAHLMIRTHRRLGRIASGLDQVWPCLSPLMFRSTLEAALQTTVRTRRHSRLVRSMMSMLSHRMAAYPLEHGYPAAPFTLGYLPQFVPAAWRCAKRAWDRTQEKYFAPRTASKPARLELMRDEEVREILNPVTMCLGRLIDPSLLWKFLESSRQVCFAFDLQWRRVLAAEMTLRFVSDRRLEMGGG